TGFSLTLLARELADTSWLIVTATDEAAERLYEDLRFFHAMLGLSSEALALFPEWETLPYESTPPHVELIARRMRTLHRLVGAGPPPPQMERSRTTLVTSVPALVQRLLPASVFSEACLRIRPGDTLERETLASRLLRLGDRRGSVIVWHQPQDLARKAKEFYDEAVDAYARHGSHGEGGPYPTPDRLYLPWSAILERTHPWPDLAMEPLASLDASRQPVVTFPAQSPSSVGLARRGLPFSDTLATLDRLRGMGTVLLVARSRGQVDRLLALFAEHDLPATGWTPQSWTAGPASPSHKLPFY